MRRENRNEESACGFLILTKYKRSVHDACTIPPPPPRIEIQYSHLHLPHITSSTATLEMGRAGAKAMATKKRKERPDQQAHQEQEQEHQPPPPPLPQQLPTLPHGTPCASPQPTTVLAVQPPAQKPPLRRVKLHFHASVRPFLMRGQEAKLVILLPPPLVKVHDLADFLTLTYLSSSLSLSSRAAATAPPPLSVTLSIDGFHLPPSQKMAVIRDGDIILVRRQGTPLEEATSPSIQSPMSPSAVPASIPAATAAASPARTAAGTKKRCVEAAAASGREAAPPPVAPPPAAATASISTATNTTVSDTPAVKSPSLAAAKAATLATITAVPKKEGAAGRGGGGGKKTFPTKKMTLSSSRKHVRFTEEGEALEEEPEEKVATPTPAKALAPTTTAAVREAGAPMSSVTAAAPPPPPPPPPAAAVAENDDARNRVLNHVHPSRRVNFTKGQDGEWQSDHKGAAARRKQKQQQQQQQQQQSLSKPPAIFLPRCLTVVGRRCPPSATSLAPAPTPAPVVASASGAASSTDCKKAWSSGMITRWKKAGEKKEGKKEEKERQMAAGKSGSNHSHEDEEEDADEGQRDTRSGYKRPYALVAVAGEILPSFSAAAATAATEEQQQFPLFPRNQQRSGRGDSSSPSFPCLGDVLLYKTLELDGETWSPVLSPWQCGVVRALLSEGQRLEISMLPLSPGEGGEEEENEEAEGGVIEVEWVGMEEVRIRGGPTFERLKRLGERGGKEAEKENICSEGEAEGSSGRSSSSSSSSSSDEEEEDGGDDVAEMEDVVLQGAAEGPSGEAKSTSSSSSSIVIEDDSELADILQRKWAQLNGCGARGGLHRQQQEEEEIEV
eukprot:evm.model.NODE_38576_length_7909_cov_18.513340.2